MTRTLPWLSGSPAKPSSSDRNANHHPLKKRKLNVPSLDDEDTDSSRIYSPKRIGRSRTARTPSTSPPPAPPDEEFMIEGPQHDDRYIMVEDELLSVAKQFTQHLHHAEYLRLKNLAKAQNASTIQSIARPVDTKTKMSDDLQRQKAAAATHKGQKDVLRDLKSGSAKIQSRGPGSDSEDDREDDPWVGTTLHGLMTSPRRSKKSLRGLAEVKSSTRAAAGFTKSRTNPRDEPAPSTFTAQKPTRDARPADPVEDATTSGDDDDDLDASSSKPTKGSSTHPTSPSDRLGPRPRIDSRQPPFDQPGQKTLSHKSPSRYDHPADARVSSARPDSKLPHIRRNPVAENKGDLNLDDQDLLPLPQASLLSEDAVQRLARRKALQAKKTRIKEEQERKAISVDDIPTFAV